MKRFTLTVSLVATLACTLKAEPARPFSETLPGFEAMTRQLFDQSGVPGMAVGITYRGQVVYLKGYGLRQTGHPEPIDTETVFQVASCSKPMTSTALAHLVSRKVIRWDDKIKQYLPDFALQDDWVTQHLTFRDLLSHHSGLPEGAGDVLENLGAERASILHSLRLFAPAYDFRAGYAYSNYGYTAAGEAGARADHKPFAQLMQDELFKPLGMTSASVRFADYQAAPNRASSHLIWNGRPLVTVRDPDAQAPAGGVSCSIRDLLRWAQFHLDPQQTVIAREALAETYRIHSVTSNNPANFSASGYYGLGWIPSFDHKGRLHLAHSGAFFTGVRSCVGLVPQEEVGIVVVCNAFPSALPEAVQAGFMKMYDEGQSDLAYSQMVGQKVLAALSKMSAGQPTPTPLAGVPAPDHRMLYSSPFYGPARFFQREGRAWISLGQKEFPLQVSGPRQFVYTREPGKYEDITGFTIDIDPKGFTVTGLGPDQFRRFELVAQPARP